ncbi:MAG: FAD-dependent monooxygenase [Bacteroidia bacterium]|nr:FAD-dependent monooxygenase [Bacteroidia bacterium]
MHRADLLDILVQKANESGVKLHLNSGVEKYAQTTDSVSVTLSNGQAFTGDLLIGADGVHSVIQQQMHPGLEPTFTGQAAWRGLVPVNAVPKGLIKPGVTVWMGPQRHVVIYYVRGGQLLNFVAVEECDNWIQESWSKQGDLAALHASFYGWHPAVTQLLDACSETYLWGLFDRKPLNTWSDGRVTLLGDACHPMLPFMSQGAAMAIEDAYVLSQLVAEKHKVDNLESILESYEAQRKPRTSFIQNISTQNANIYHMSNPLTGNIKLWFAKLLNSVAPIYAQKRLDKVYGVDVTAE